MKESIEHTGLEQDIERLSSEIKDRGLAEKGKEGVRAVVKEQGDAEPAQTPAQADQPATAQDDHIPDYLQKEGPEVKLRVEKLLDLAIHKGLKRATSEAKKMPPLVVDAFHDALTDKLYDEMKARGLLK